MVEPQLEHARHGLAARVRGWVEPGLLERRLDRARRVAEPEVADERRVELLDRDGLRRRDCPVERTLRRRADSGGRRRRRRRLRHGHRHETGRRRQDRTGRIRDGHRPRRDGRAAVGERHVGRELVRAVRQRPRVEDVVVGSGPIRLVCLAVEREVDVVDDPARRVDLPRHEAADRRVRGDRGDERRLRRRRGRRCRLRAVLEIVGGADRIGERGLGQRRLRREVRGGGAEDALLRDGADLRRGPVAGAGKRGRRRRRASALRGRRRRRGGGSGVRSGPSIGERSRAARPPPPPNGDRAARRAPPSRAPRQASRPYGQ